MRIRTWLINLFGGINQTAKEQELLAQSIPSKLENMDKEAEGLNFKLAIEAHQKWKKRLSDVVDGNSDEVLQVDLVSRDDQCLLGKWIHGPGSQKFWLSEQFIRLKNNHAHFHVCAGNVLHLAQTDRQQEAALELKEGDYTRVSQEVIRDLVAVYTQVEIKPKAAVYRATYQPQNY